MKYSVFGPFLFEKIKKEIATDRKRKSKFWANIESAAPGLSNGIGCYIFSLENGANSKPWYVGQTKRLSFKGEIFQKHKIDHYNEVLKAHNGSIEFFLIAKRTPKGAFSKPQKGKKKTTHTDIDNVETMLIGAALNKNQNLRNVKGTKIFNRLVVPGFINDNQGKPIKSAQYLRNLL